MECLFERARGDDPRAREAVVAALRPRLTRMAAYYARCTGEDADDLLQEAWVGVLDSLPVLDIRIGSPDQFLIQRARWRLLDAVKRARIRRCLSLEDAPGDLPGPASDDALASVCAWDFTQRLNTTQRSVLHYLLAGCTWREVGSKLGCTSANIAYHVRQIRRQYEKWAA